MLKQYKQAIELWKHVFDKPYTSKYHTCIGDLFTDDPASRLFDVYSYFHSDFDNDDVLYDILDMMFFDVPPEDKNKIYFFAGLIRDLYQPLCYPLPELECGDVDENRWGYIYTDEYLFISELNRQRVKHLLNSGYFDNYITNLD